MTKSPAQSLLPLLCALPICLVALAKPAQCETPGLEKIDAPIAQSESKLQRLQSGMELHFGKLEIIGREEFDLLEQIENLDKKLELQKIRLEIMVERLRTQEELLAVKKRDLNNAQDNKAKVKEHLEKRLRSFYLMGKTGVLNVTFSTRTLPNLMLFNDSFKTLLDYDKRIFDNYRESIAQLTIARDEHKKESIQLNEYISTALEQQMQLDALLADKKELLAKVKTQKTLHEQAIKELKKAEADLQSTLAMLRTKRAYTVQGFVLNKGKMAQPVKGALLTRFGETGEAGAEAGLSTGIAIDAPDGAPIKAIFAGKILFTGYRKGYGNMVIIDHGMNYYSITARMEKITVKEGDLVEEGGVIGAAGDIATLFEKGVYFEIREDAAPIDPLEWITLSQ